MFTKGILINPVLNGFIVKVGCTEVVFTDIDVLCFELKRYYKNPGAVEAEYQKSAINKGLDQIEPEKGHETNRVDSVRVGMPYTATEAAERPRR